MQRAPVTRLTRRWGQIRLTFPRAAAFGNGIKAGALHALTSIGLSGMNFASGVVNGATFGLIDNPDSDSCSAAYRYGGYASWLIPMGGGLGVAAKAAGRARKAEEVAGPVFRSDATHIFRAAPGHLAQDTMSNRALIRQAIAPDYAQSSVPLPDGTVLLRYKRVLPDGRQVWAEVRNGEITNGGVNYVPRF